MFNEKSLHADRAAAPATAGAPTPATMNPAARFAVILLLAAFSVGCGAGMSQNDMHRYAIRRPAEDDETASPTKTAAAERSNVPPAQSQTAAPPPQASVDKRTPMPPPAVAAPREEPQRIDVADASDDEATPEAQPLSDRQSPPLKPLSPHERLERTVANLKRIGQAFEAHRKDKNIYPARAIFSESGEPLLSWRVALLPYQGYKELYAQFRLDEPWNSEHNQKLLGHIPAVYQSPERFDEKTNYQVPVGSSTIFHRDRGMRAERIEDGAANTVLVLEVDEALAAPWTEPRDYELDLKAPAANLGSLRADSFFVIWGDGAPGRVLAAAPADALKAIFTIDGGEDFAARQIDQPLLAAQATPDAARPATFEATATGFSGQTANDRVPDAQSAAHVAIAALATRYFQHSQEALAQQRERDAMHWFYAGAIVAPPGGDWTARYRWVPALKRPVPLMRLGIGLNYSGPRAKEIQKAVSASLIARGNSTPPPWKAVTGEFGEHLISALSSHWKEHFGEPTQHPLNRNARVGTRQSSLLSASHDVPLADGVCFLAVARETILVQAARREAVDVLLVVDWRDAGHKWSARVKLIDVLRGEPLLTLPRLSSEALTEATRNPLSENPLAAMMQALNNYLDESLATQPLPEQIKPRHVAGRIEALAANKEGNPLRALAEMRFYCERGLADNAQLLSAYQTLLGQRSGGELMLGNDAAKETLLKAWLPQPPPMETIGQLGYRSAHDDD